MGYRSDVALVLKTEDYKKELEMAENIDDDKKIDLFLNPDDVHSNEEYTVICWDWIKWYDGMFPDVDYVENIRARNDSLFIRVGEDNNDCEEILNGDDYDMFEIASLSRTINVLNI